MLLNRLIARAVRPYTRAIHVIRVLYEDEIRVIRVPYEIGIRAIRL
jgi:hypothetical protein